MLMDYYFSKEWFQLLLIGTASLILAWHSLPYFSWDVGFDENLKYILSTLPQTQGAIVGIVASISIVAIQMVSQQYSTRITHLLLNKTYWGLIIVYIISMSYEILLLGFMPTARIPVYIWGVEVPYYILIWILFFLIYFDFLILLPYTKNTINSLKPENVIENLIQSIKRDEINNYRSIDSENIDYRSARKIPKNTLRTVYYIIDRSLKANHYLTARNGLILLGSNYVPLSNNGKSKNKFFFENYIENIENLGISAYGAPFSISREAIISLEKIFKYELERNTDLSLRALLGIKKIGLLYAQEFELKIDNVDERKMLLTAFNRLQNILEYLLLRFKNCEKVSLEKLEAWIEIYFEILRINEQILFKLHSKRILNSKDAEILIMESLNSFSNPFVRFILVFNNDEVIKKMLLKTLETLKSYFKLVLELKNENIGDFSEYFLKLTAVYGKLLDEFYEKSNYSIIHIIISDMVEITENSNGYCTFNNLFENYKFKNESDVQKAEYFKELKKRYILNLSKNTE